VRNVHGSLVEIPLAERVDALALQVRDTEARQKSRAEAVGGRAGHGRRQGRWGHFAGACRPLGEEDVWLNADNDCIEVEHEIENPTRESRGRGAVCTAQFQSERRPVQRHLVPVPSSQGVVYSILPTQRDGKSYGTDWVLEPTAGWIGVRDQRPGGA